MSYKPVNDKTLAGINRVNKIFDGYEIPPFADPKEGHKIINSLKKLTQERESIMREDNWREFATRLNKIDSDIEDLGHKLRQL